MAITSLVGAFPVVCVGGAAAALDDYIGLIRHIPSDLGVAIVVINYMANVAGELQDALPRYTEMPIEPIADGVLVQPNHVFIVQEERDVHVRKGKFYLKPISKPMGWPNVVTVFFRSISQNWTGKLIAVILSGYDGDGAPALCGIREVGGICLAQKVETAGQPDMPLSAIASGCIDFVLSVENIAKEIERIVRDETHEGHGLGRSLISEYGST